MTDHGRSLYLTMRDGVRLAVDAWLPPEALVGASVGTVVRATRYWRAAVGSADVTAQEAEVALFNGANLALVTVDVRGTGASFGVWSGPWSAEEVDDLGEVVDWIVAQPWSNGRVGAHGVSYDGNTAELLAATGRRAVVAVAPRFADYDPWAQLSFPGGVLLDGFLTGWAAQTHALDLDDPSLVTSSQEEADDLRAWIGHPKPVDGDDGSLVAAAVEEHKANVDLFSAVDRLECFDDEASRLLGYPQAAPFARRSEIEQGGAALWSVGSWYDAGTAAGVLARFTSTVNPHRAVIGAWSHGGLYDASPFHDEPGSAGSPPVAQQREELLGWLVERLTTGAAEMSGRTLAYVTVGSDSWRTTSQWPPEGVVDERHWLTAQSVLEGSPEGAGEVVYRVDPSTSSGAQTNRWQTQAEQAPVTYPDRAAADSRCAVWTGPKLLRETTITGTPVVHLRLSTTATDGAVHAYLEAVAPDGRVVYLTEGVLRLLHRALGPAPYGASGPYHPCTRALAGAMTPGVTEDIDIALFPVSAQIPVGWRLRLALAGADEGSFRGIATDGALWTIQCGTEGSWLDVPVETTS